MEQIGAVASRIIPTPTTRSSGESGEDRQREAELALFRKGLPSRFRGRSFDDFDPDPDAEALDLARRFHAACENWFKAGRPDEPPGPILFLTSERAGEVVAPGNGKSLLAACVLESLASDWLRIYRHERTGEQWPNLVFVTTEQVISEVRACYRRDDRTPDEVVGRYLAADVLVLDDVGTEPSGEDATSRLFRLLEFRRKPLVLTSNYSTKQLRARSPEWAKLVSRMRERMLGSVLRGPDRREPEGDPWKVWR